MCNHCRSSKRGNCVKRLCDCDRNVISLGQKKFKPEYDITKSGRYCLTENIIWQPLTNGESCDNPIAAITISVSNVELDLNNYTLSQQTGLNGVPLRTFSVGIKVLPGVTNVIIHNGTIQDMGSMGIYIKAAPQVNISTILIENMTIQRCGQNSSLSTGLSFGAACGTTVFFANAAGAIGLFGIVSGGTQVAFVEKVVIRKCRLLDYGIVPGADNIGIAGLSIVDVLVDQCIIKGLNPIPASVTASAGVDGLGIIFAEDLIVTNCEISDINGLNVYATASKYIFVNRFEIIDTTISNVFQTGTLNPVDLLGTVTVVNATGIKLLSSSNGVIKNCIVNKVFSDLAVVDSGFSSAAQAMLITESDNIVVEDCTFGGINYAGNVGFGAGITTSSTNSLYKNIKITNVTSNTGETWGVRCQQYNQGGGFFPVFNPVFGNVFDYCVIENVGNSALTTANQGGFLIRSNSGLVNENNILKNSILRGNVGHGLLVDGADAKNNMIQHNKISKNTRDGIQDNTSLAIDKNVYVSNEAYKNPINFVTLPAGTPISIWNLTAGALPVTQRTFDNLDIV